MLDHSCTACFRIAVFAIAPQFARRGDRADGRERDGHTEHDDENANANADDVDAASGADSGGNERGREDNDGCGSD